MAKGLAINLESIRVNVVVPEPSQHHPGRAFGMPQEQLEVLKMLPWRSPLTGEFGYVEDLMEAYLYGTRSRNVTRSLISTWAGAFLN